MRTPYNYPRQHRDRVGTLHRVVTIFILALSMLCACQNSTHQNQDTTKDSQNHTTIPELIQRASNHELGSVRAFLRVDAGEPQAMQLEGGTMRLSLTNLSEGRHEFSIEFQFHWNDTAIDPLVLASVTNTVDIVAGNNQLLFEEKYYNYEYDQDEDLRNNIDELIKGYNPLQRDPIFNAETSQFNFEENLNVETSLFNVSARTPVPDNLVYTLPPNVLDNNLFQIDNNSGAVYFLDSPDFETPASYRSSNEYEIEVLASDGEASNTQRYIVRIQDIFEIDISADIKTLNFSWYASATASYYKLLHDQKNSGVFASINDSIPGLFISHALAVHQQNWTLSRYKVQAFNDLDELLIESPALAVNNRMLDTIGYVKPGDPETNMYFGMALAFSADGHRLAVGSSARDTNNLADAGAVYIFDKDANGQWGESAIVVPIHKEAGDDFGKRVALSDDGRTLVASAPSENNSYVLQGAVPVSEPDPMDDARPKSGAVYVFEQNQQGVWVQKAFIKASNPDSGDYFGEALALSGDGLSLAVASNRENGLTPGIDNTGPNFIEMNDNTGNAVGAIYIYDLLDGFWLQSAFIKASNADSNDLFGYAMDINQDGTRLAVGAPGESSNSVSNPDNDGALGSGAVYTFMRKSRTSNWIQEDYIKPNVNRPGDSFGKSVSLDNDGLFLAAGAPGEDSLATGINQFELQTDNSQQGSGAAYVFRRIGSNWSQQFYVKASNTESGDQYGLHLSLSAVDAANTAYLAVSSIFEGSDVLGVSDPAFETQVLQDSGAAYLYRLTLSGDGASDSMSLMNYIKPTNTKANNQFAEAIRLNKSTDPKLNGATLAIGAPRENSAASGINDNTISPFDTSMDQSGAVYLY